MVSMIPRDLSRGWTEPTPPARPRCYWLREALAHDQSEPCPPLRGEVGTDVAIVGGGYTGMWSAYFLTELEPAVRVVLLEQDICGGGPSGRNGGFVTGWWDELPGLVRLYGERGAVEACRAAARSVAGIGTWCARHGVDAWFTDGGYLMVATSGAQEGRWSAATELARRLGAGEAFADVPAAEVRARCGSPVFRSGAFMRDGATVQPARLARGLRRVLLERGVRIFEGSPVRRFRAGPPTTAETPGGVVRAERAILALNTWLASWKPLRRSLVTWGSYIVLSAPAPERLEEMGWTGGECITDARFALHYFRTTPDGRIAFGGGGGRAGIGGRVGPRLSYDVTSIRRAAEGFRRLFPTFADVPLEEAWGGPIDVSPTHLPFFGTLPAGNVHYGVGYSGNGVAPSHLGGRILAGLALGREDEFTRLPMVNAEPRAFPPEPLRSLGAFLVREAVVRKERAEDEGRRADPFTRFLARLPRRLGYLLGPE